MGEGERSGEGAIAWRGTQTVVGFDFGLVAGLGVGFAGSVPIPGSVCVVGIWADISRSMFGSAGHPVQLGIASDIPGTQAEMDAAVPLLPEASSESGGRGCLVFCNTYSGRIVPVCLVVGMNGRRFVGRWTNVSVSDAGGYVGFVVARVSGGEAMPGVSFLGGEGLVWR